ncbi:MAG: hypothetical protein LBD50_02490 [Rickettsiales bacterium]|jgi:hypothetical protein|nr:hypothetical protein [Rickettsiales bacterium]
MPNPKGGFFWALIGAALLSAGRAQAGESDSNGKSSFARDTISKSSGMDSSDFFYDVAFNASYSAWPDSEKFIRDHILSRSDVRMDTIYVMTKEQVFNQLMAYYNPNANNFVIKRYQLEPKFKKKAESYPLNSQSWEEFQLLKSALAQAQAELVAIWIHEFQHYLNARINLAGLSADEVALFCFFDEISARAKELAFRRKIYFDTGSLQQAFKGAMRADQPSEYKTSMLQSHAEWLSRNKIDARMTPREAQKIIGIAAGGFSADWHVYASRMPDVVLQRLHKLLKQLRLHASGAASLPLRANDFNSVLSEMFDFGDESLFELAGDKVFEDIAGKVKKMTRREKIRKIIDGYSPALDMCLEKLFGKSALLASKTTALPARASGR